MIIGIDFDGTCVTHDFPHIGKEIGATDVLQEIIRHGHKLILYTMRSDISNPYSDDKDIIGRGGTYLSDALDWFSERGIPLYGVNENPSQKSWTTSPKPYCNLYIDDSALGCPKAMDRSLSPYLFADWKEIERYLKRSGIL